MDAKDVVEIREIVDLLDDAVFLGGYCSLEVGHIPVEDLIEAATEAANRLEALVQGRGHG